jgi:hypothetical protein
MGGACSTQGRKQGMIQNFGLEASVSNTLKGRIMLKYILWKLN